MASPRKDPLDRIEYFILKIVVILLELVAAAKLLIAEIKSLF